MRSSAPALHWLVLGDPFPPLAKAWGPETPAPGLLAGGGMLDVDTLVRAYSQGIFPWFSQGQPILWWSPDPRMVLEVQRFRLRRSLRKVIERFRNDSGCEIRIDTVFGDVIAACASTPRNGQTGTWIVPEMVSAYRQLHAAGIAHSVETWVDGQLVAGLYCLALGQAVFGESMFTRVTDGSKIALAALVGFCRHHGIALIDCQQNTRHLASLGAAEMPRACFAAHVATHVGRPGPVWHFDPVYWSEPLPLTPVET
jgi:leucyl/phenylalanyl-tRNA---protein transferase